MDYSRTERIVFLIDLHPLIHLKKPNSYVATVISAARKLTSFPSLSNSLFAFKLFFSSLSPLLSISSLHRLLGTPPPSSLSFNTPHQTLSLLSEILNRVSTSSASAELVDSEPRALHVAGSLGRLVHDYSWELQSEDLSGTLNNSPAVPSNLVLLFSPNGMLFENLSEFMNLGVGNEALMNSDVFGKSFRDCFGAISDSFVNRHIHCSWVDVMFQRESNENAVKAHSNLLQLGFLKNSIRSLGWGYCSSDSIILGSALIPFGLIYPVIGISFPYFCNKDYGEPNRAQLTLEITDVSGKPLKWKCCDLEFLKLKKPTTLGTGDIMHDLKLQDLVNGSLEKDTRFLGRFSSRTADLRIKVVQKLDECVVNKALLSDAILVRGYSREKDKSGKKCNSSFYADRVVEVLSSEMGEVICRKTVPIWQILLCFLHRNGYTALVSLSSGNADSLVGIIEPFTTHLALLYTIDERCVMKPDADGLNRCKIVDDGVCKPHANVNPSNESPSSQQGTVAFRENVLPDQESRKRNKKHVYRELTWTSFREAASQCSALELEESYFASEYSKSKKLKFLKCWMKQVNDFRCGGKTIPQELEFCQSSRSKAKVRLVGGEQESEQPVSLFSAGPSREHGDVSLLSTSETSEAFFRTLPQKISDGLESKGVDLQILAERLVNLSTYWLYQKNESDNMENQIPSVRSDESCGNMVAATLIKLLLKDPKELKEKHKDNFPCFSTSDTSSTPENMVREHELQIFLRMEILRSKVSGSIEASKRRKLVKQICLLLEIIQYLVEGGFHGHMNLFDYVERTIKSRYCDYCHALGDVVNKLYEEMDLLPCGDEKDSPIHLPNSEDSNQSRRDVESRRQESISATGEESQEQEDGRKEEHIVKLREAQERRERAKRMGSFTTWVPDLRKVVAPKPSKVKFESSQRQQQNSKRKARSSSRGSSRDVVCETPLVGKQRNGSCSGSVSKALFQDDN